MHDFLHLPTYCHLIQKKWTSALTGSVLLMYAKLFIDRFEGKTAYTKTEKSHLLNRQSKIPLASKVLDRIRSIVQLTGFGNY